MSSSWKQGVGDSETGSNPATHLPSKQHTSSVSCNSGCLSNLDVLIRNRYTKCRLFQQSSNFQWHDVWSAVYVLHTSYKLLYCSPGVLILWLCWPNLLNWWPMLVAEHYTKSLRQWITLLNGTLSTCYTRCLNLDHPFSSYSQVLLVNWP